jgi:hypothetical protein
MSDPISVIRSAVDIISLGLTVCQGLLTYHGPFKVYKPRGKQQRDRSEVEGKWKGVRKTGSGCLEGKYMVSPPASRNLSLIKMYKSTFGSTSVHFGVGLHSEG